METLKRMREPLAWAMVALTALELVLVVLQMLLYGDFMVLDNGEVDGGTVISYLLSAQTVDYALLFGLTLAVWGCALAPATARARTVALAAAWLATLVVAAPWIAAVISFLDWPARGAGISLRWDWWTVSSLLYPLVYTGAGVVATVALWALARRPQDDAPDDEEQDEDELALEAGDAAADEPEPEDEQPTVWKPAEAAGAVWRTADEAASGAPGARFLDPSSGDEPDATPRAEHDWRPPGAS